MAQSADAVIALPGDGHLGGAGRDTYLEATGTLLEPGDFAQRERLLYPAAPVFRENDGREVHEQSAIKRCGKWPPPRESHRVAARSYEWSPHFINIRKRVVTRVVRNELFRLTQCTEPSNLMETVFQVIPDTVQDSLSIYLRANERWCAPM